MTKRSIVWIVIVFVVVAVISVIVSVMNGAESTYVSSATSTSNVILQSGSSIASTSVGAVVGTSSSAIPGYFVVTDTCNWQYEGGACVNVRTGPGVSYPRAIMYLGPPVGDHTYSVRYGQMFKVTEQVIGTDGQLWDKVTPDTSGLLYPDRIQGDWYIAAQYLQPADFTRIDPQADQTKSIVVHISTQTLDVYEGTTLVKSMKVSTGLPELPTPIGNFHILAKDPLVTMEGPLPGLPLVDGNNDYYTLFVPYSMPFDCGSDGCDFLHAAYWHNSFGQEHSHGCVNLDFADAEWLYNWTPSPSVATVSVTVVQQ